MQHFRHKIKLLTLLVCCFKLSYAQDLDQLKSELKKNIHDTVRLKIIVKIIELSEDDETLKYNQIRKQIDLENLAKLDPKSQLYKHFCLNLAHAYHVEGIYYFNQSDLRKALKFQEKSLEMYEKFPGELKKADPLYEIAKIHTLNGNYKQAIQTFFTSLRNYEKSKTYVGVADCYAGLAEIYSSQDQMNLAIESNKQAVKYYEKSREYDGASVALCNISDCLILLKRYSEAAFYIQETEKYKSHLLDYELALIQLQKGVLAEELYHTNEAIEHYNNSLELYENEDEDALVCSINHKLARVFFVQKKDTRKAIQYAERALDLAKSMQLPYIIEGSNYLLYEIYKYKGDRGKSLFYLEEYLEMLNLKNSIEVKNTLFQEKLKYDFEKKELQNKLRSERKLNKLKLSAERASFQKNALIFSSLGLLLILGIIFVSVTKNTRQKKTIAEQKSNILKQKLLVSQMNPHFIFNSLNAIQNCIFKEDGLTAGTYLAQFAELMRMILDFSRKDNVSLESEVRLLENYLQLQQFRFNNKFDYSIKIDPGLIPSQIQIPPMLAQPFIENAIEHGVFYLEEKGLIRLSISKNGENLRFEIEDNGIGLRKSEDLKPKLKTHTSLATIITQERINELFSGQKVKSKIEIHDLCLENEEKRGVRVSFEIPLINTRS